MKRPPKTILMKRQCGECKVVHTWRIYNHAWLAYHRIKSGSSLRALARHGKISAPTLCLFEQGTYKGGPTPRILRVYRSVLP